MTDQLDAPRITALVLAGKRDGALDPLAAAFGVTHKCLVPVAGRPLIEHVVTALAAAPAVARILISIDGSAEIEQIVPIRTLIAAGRLAIVASQPDLAASVIAAARQARFPLLITTADNVLLTPAAIAAMQRGICASGADVAVAFAAEAAVRVAHPEGQRRFYRFADGGYANCNCYWISDSEALAAAGIFREGGQFAKHPWRIATAFGLANLIRFRLGIGTLERALQRFSKRLGLEVRPILFEDGALAIDVDNARTHRIAEALLTVREEQAVADADRDHARRARPALTLASG